MTTMSESCNLKMYNAGGLHVANSRDLTLFKTFLAHILTATVLFICIAAAAVTLETLADWIEARHYSAVLSIGCHAAAYYIFASDIVFLIFFLTVEVLKFGREVWRSFKRQ
ncbi:hypothetical protein RPMA_09090 [Tardiphaga alba]|uniref:Uncharacterized protein n=1 Tax=Tardiphaga alba TaxID=340268 RepID=A0ABX8A6V2_9BRAD|nr:hypothetical protein [Tardiphaga alba]QUS38962.1 hypothetical protein RPMA_09090 [Tardiphaga alba]